MTTYQVVIKAQRHKKLQSRAVARFLCVWGGGGGGRAVPDPKIFFKQQSGQENCFCLLWAGDMSPENF